MNENSKNNFSGQDYNETEIKRIDRNYILEEIREAFSFQKGFMFTIKELAVNPGDSVKEFIKNDRKRLVKPVLFIVFTSLIYSILKSFLWLEFDNIVNSGNENSAIFKMLIWTQENYGYSNIIMAIFIGFWIRLFFRKYKYNIFEILVLLCFVMGFGMLIFSVFAVVEAIMNQVIVQIAGIFVYIYTSWAIGQFYGKRKVINYIKAFFAYFLGMVTFGILLISIGLTIDLLN